MLFTLLSNADRVNCLPNKTASDTLETTIEIAVIGALSERLTHLIAQD